MDELRRYRKRWNRVHAIERAELERMSFEEKLLKISTVFNVATALGLPLNLRREKGVKEVRSRWLVLKNK